MNESTSIRYTQRTDELLLTHGQQVADLQQSLDLAVTQRSTMAQRLAVEELVSVVVVLLHECWLARHALGDVGSRVLG
jgi:hypothetical protein